MKRRGFIKTGIVTIAAGSTSNVALGEIFIPMAENISHLEMENFISDLDIRMDRISSSGGDYLNSLINHTPTETEQDFFKSSLRTLLLIGSFGDLPTKGQVHPWMQKRLLYSEPEINYSITSSIDVLKNMSDDTTEDIRSALDDDPDLGDRIMEALDLEAQAIGVSAARRRQMRMMGKSINRRLKHSPEMLISEYVKKADKLLMTSNSDEDFEQFQRAQMGEEKYLKIRNEAEAAALQWSKMNINDIPVGYEPIIAENDYNKQSKDEIDLKKKKAGTLLGIGVASTAVGWLLIALGAWVGVILGVTIGPFLILLALILLSIYAIKSKKSQA